MEALIKFVQDEFVTKKEFAEFAAGDTITVYYEIKEGEKVRTQFFRGVVIQRRGTGLSETFTIRKMSGTVGVERIFPVNLPSIQKIMKISEKSFKKILKKKKRNSLPQWWCYFELANTFQIICHSKSNVGAFENMLI
jgi:large subunit ribosomal protein L19